MLNNVDGPNCKKLYLVSTKSGELLSSAENIRDGWVKRFNKLLSQPTDVDWDILDEVEQCPTIEAFDKISTM